jgi:hypothetical protein
MSPEPESTTKEHLKSMMEDFGRFNPAQTAEPDDANITGDDCDEDYREENAGA